MPEPKRKLTFDNVTAFLCLVGCVLFAAGILHAARSAFFSLNYLMSDYGVYTNTIWNLSRFNGFQFLIDHSYLKTHLSFSLILLAPLFWLFDSPATLLYAQWFCMLAGAVFLLRIAARTNVHYSLSFPIAFLFIAYPFMQSVLLSEFHGVSLYLILIPWLILTLEGRKRATWAPLILLLGLREETGFLLPLIFIYYAWRDKWALGYVYAAVSIAYACLALLVLYPLMTGASILSVRAPEAGASSLLSAWTAEGIATRLKATGWLGLMALPFFVLYPRRSRPLVLFALIPYLWSMLSGVPRQHGLQFHYPAILLATICPAMIVALKNVPAPTDRTRGLTAMLMAVTLIAHVSSGFVIHAPRSHEDYRGIKLDGKSIMSVAQHLDKKGILVCNKWAAVFCANRQFISIWEYWNPEQYPADAFLSTYDEIREHPDVLRTLETKSLGVVYEEFPHVLIARGGDPGRNRAVLDFINAPHIAAFRTHRHAGDNVYVKGDGLLRHWHGDGRRGPATILFGSAMSLDAGRYEVTFTYRANRPVRPVRNIWGTFSLHEANQPDALTQVEIRRQAAAGFVSQTLVVELKHDTQIEPRVTAGDAELWVMHITFKKEI